MPLFSFGPKKIFTVDPGNHAIKIAQFSSQKGSFILEKFLSFPVPKESVREDGLFNKKSLSQPLLQFIKENIEGSGYKLRICISGKFTFIKKIEIPREEKKLMRELIHMEAKETLPFHLNEINYSYKILDHIQASQENKVNILLVSARKDAIHNYEDLFKKMGLRCELIDIGGVALANCVKFTEEENLSEDSSVLVVDIGKSGTELSVVNNGELIFSRYFTVGGDFYNNTLMSEMGINYAEAEHLKTKNPVEEKSQPEVHH